MYEISRYSINEVVLIVEWYKLKNLRVVYKVYYLNTYEIDVCKDTLSK